MKKTGAWLARYALEQIGIRHTFGIPGVHNTELYDELHASKRITPVLVSHEGGGAFMADAVSRLSDSTGCLAIVPAAGATHAASGIGEAYLDGIPMLVISGGIRADIPQRYQLHDIDQHAFMAALCKRTFRVTRHQDVVPTLFEAHNVAIAGEPGPVFVEIPVNIQLLTGEVDSLPAYRRWQPPPVDGAAIERAVELLRGARRSAIFAGWGARRAGAQLVELAERLGAPVSTSLQGLAVFPADHPLHTGFGFGPSAVPAARESFADCDCLLAVGVRFGEIATGSFGAQVPADLIHVDINPAVFNANYPARVAIEADAAVTLDALLERLREQPERAADDSQLQRIRRLKDEYLQTWLRHDSGDRVNPAVFFQGLRGRLPDDGVVVADDGNHTFLAAELMPIHRGGAFISPTDFNCMGYSVPAAIGAKLARPDRTVAAIVGDGCFAMTCMEITTAAAMELGVMFFIFNDGTLSQIAQAQQVPYNRTPCTRLGEVDYSAIARGLGAEFVGIRDNEGVGSGIDRAFTLSAAGRPVVVDVNVDYSRRTAFTEGTVKTTFKRFDLGTRVRFASRAVARRITG